MLATRCEACQTWVAVLNIPHQRTAISYHLLCAASQPSDSQHKERVVLGLVALQR
jgi:hypothetical protein